MFALSKGNGAIHLNPTRSQNFLTTGWRTPESQTTIYFHSDKASQFPISSAWCKHHLIFSPRQWYHKTLPLCLFALQSCQLTIVVPLCQAQPHAIYRSSVDKESMFWLGYSFSLCFREQVEADEKWCIRLLTPGSGHDCDTLDISKHVAYSQ